MWWPQVLNDIHRADTVHVDFVMVLELTLGGDIAGGRLHLLASFGFCSTLCPYRVTYGYRATPIICYVMFWVVLCVDV